MRGTLRARAGAETGTAAAASGFGRAFQTLRAAVACSDLADGVVKVAVPLAALGLTRSAAGVGAVGIAVRLPWLVATLPAGVVVDRCSPRPVLRWAAGLRLAVLASLAGLAVGHRLDLPSLAALAFLAGCCGVLVDVTAQAAVPRFVDVDQLPRANASVQSVQVTTSQLLAPAIGGAAAQLGAGWGLAAAGACHLLAVLAFSALPHARTAGQTGHGAGGVNGSRSLRSVVGEVAEGLRHLGGRGDLRRLALVAATNNLSYAMCLTMLPLWAVRPGRLGLTERGYGLLVAAMAVGSIGAGLAAARVLRRTGDRWIRQVGAPLLGLCFLAVGAGSVPVAVVALVGYGAVSLLWNVVVVSYRQSTVPSDLFGRVNAAFRWVTWGVIPVGAAVGGSIASLAGTRAVFLVAGSLPLGVGAALALRPDRRPPSTPAPPSPLSPPTPDES